MVSVWVIPTMLLAGAVIGFCIYGIIDPPDYEYQKGFANAKKQYKKTVSFKCLDRGLYLDLTEIVIALSKDFRVPDEYRRAIDEWGEKYDIQGGQDANT